MGLRGDFRKINLIFGKRMRKGVGRGRLGHCPKIYDDVGDGCTVEGGSSAIRIWVCKRVLGLR